MTDGDSALEPVAQLGLGDRLQGQNLPVLRLADMQINVEAIFGSGSEQQIEAFLQVRHQVGDATQNTLVLPDDSDKIVKKRRVENLVQWEQRGRLQRDPVFPRVTDFGKDLERNAVLGAMESRCVRIRWVPCA